MSHHSRPSRISNEYQIGTNLNQQLIDTIQEDKADDDDDEESSCEDHASDEELTFDQMLDKFQNDYY